MATRQADGSIRLANGRVIYADTPIYGGDLHEVVALLAVPAWPFVSGGGGSRGGGGGAPGRDGAQGPEGPAGPFGGPQGFQGSGGLGPQGGLGIQGALGLQGPSIQGPQGGQGLVGPQGPLGNQGAIGNQGNIGGQGAQGNPGVQGPQGILGPQGAQGNQGDIGAQGFQGTNPGPQGSQGPVSSLTTVEALAVGGGTTGTLSSTFVAIGAQVSFTLAAPMVVFFEGYATASPDPINNALDVQLGINIDGTDYPGTAAVFGTSGSFVWMPMSASKGILLGAGLHTADLVFRKPGLSVATQALVETNATFPAKLTAVY